MNTNVDKQRGKTEATERKSDLKKERKCTQAQIY